MLSPENKWICLEYFYENRNRHVNWAGLINELGRKINPPDSLQRMWTDFDEVYLYQGFTSDPQALVPDNPNDLLRINERGIAEYLRLKKFKEKEQERIEVADETARLNLKSIKKQIQVKWYQKPLAWTIIFGFSTLCLGVLSIYLNYKSSTKDWTIIRQQILIKQYEKQGRF
jgi:hypothetical protein